MESVWAVEIYWLDEIDSTQRYLIDELKASRLIAPVCVGASFQNQGRGSRGNSWAPMPGNLFISFALSRNMLPHDLKLESSSIYFAYLLKDLLSEKGSKVWLKWPNDFYIGEKKIGGVITNILQDMLVCGIGMNLNQAPEDFGVLDVRTEPYLLTESYVKLFKKLPLWKHIFSKYELEFENNRKYFTHYENQKIALKDVVLLEDGSLECSGQRIFSLR